MATRSDQEEASSAVETPIEQRRRRYRESIAEEKRNEEKSAVSQLGAATSGVSQQVSQIMEPVIHVFGSHHPLSLSGTSPPARDPPPADKPLPPTSPRSPRPSSPSSRSSWFWKFLFGPLLLLGPVMVYRGWNILPWSGSKVATPLEMDIRAWIKDLAVQANSGPVTNERLTQGVQDLTVIEKAVLGSDEAIQGAFIDLLHQAQSRFNDVDSSSRDLLDTFKQRNESWPRQFAYLDQDLGEMNAAQKGVGLFNFVVSILNPSTKESLDFQIQHRLLKYSHRFHGEVRSLDSRGKMLAQSIERWMNVLASLDDLVGAHSSGYSIDLKRIHNSYVWRLLRIGNKRRYQVIEWMKQVLQMDKPVCEATKLAQVMHLESVGFSNELHGILEKLDESLRACESDGDCLELEADLLPLNRRLAELGASITYDDARSKGAKGTRTQGLSS